MTSASPRQATQVSRCPRWSRRETPGCRGRLHQATTRWIPRVARAEVSCSRQIHSRRRDRGCQWHGEERWRQDPAGGRGDLATATPDPGAAGCRRPHHPESQPSQAAGALLRPSSLLRSKLGMATPCGQHLSSSRAQQRRG
jgi:hypothetical protein